LPGRRVWVLCPDVRTQDQLHSELMVWQCPALYFPRQSLPAAEALPDPDQMAERVSVLSRWREQGPDCPGALLVCADSLEEPAPAAQEIESRRRTLEAGGRLDPEAFLQELDEAGYERVPVVMERGQFA